MLALARDPAPSRARRRRPRARKEPFGLERMIDATLSVYAELRRSRPPRRSSDRLRLVMASSQPQPVPHSSPTAAAAPPNELRLSRSGPARATDTALVASRCGAAGGAEEGGGRERRSLRRSIQHARVADHVVDRAENAGDTFFTLLLPRPEASRSIGGRLDARHGARQFVCLKSILISVPLLILYLHRTFPWLASASGPQRAPTRCCSRITSRSCERGVEAGPHRRLHSAAMRSRSDASDPRRPAAPSARARTRAGRARAGRPHLPGRAAGRRRRPVRARARARARRRARPRAHARTGARRRPARAPLLAPCTGGVRTRRGPHARVEGGRARPLGVGRARARRARAHVPRPRLGGLLRCQPVARAGRAQRRLARSTDRVVAVSHGRRTISCVWAWSKRASWS